MRAPRWLREFFGWRWAPFVALVMGSLLFIALAMLLIPMSFGVTPSVAAWPSVAGTPFVAATPAVAPSVNATSDGNTESPVARDSLPPPPPVNHQPIGSNDEPVGGERRGFPPNIVARGDRPERSERPPQLTDPTSKAPVIPARAVSTAQPEPDEPPRETTAP